MNFYLVTYDISNPKRLHKVFQCLSDFGHHRQLSVFECWLTNRKLVQLKNRLTRIIDSEDDQVLIISLCRDCVGKIDSLGRRRIPPDPRVMIC